jgi:hypothetical protein
MTDQQKTMLIAEERIIWEARQNFDSALKLVFLNSTIETIVGKNLVHCKVVDVEDGKLVLENGTRREWRRVEPIVICDWQEMGQRHEVEKALKEKVCG